MSTGYNVLVLLHLLCVVGGFGGLAYNGLYLLLSRRRNGAAVVLEINGLVSSLSELLTYAAFVLGLAAIGASHSTYKFSQAWVSAAFAIFLALVGIHHGFIRPQRRRYDTLSAELAGRSPAPSGERPSDELSALERLEKRIALGWGVFNIGVVVIIYLMVFKPGK